MTWRFRTLAWNFTRSPQWAHSTVLPGSTSRSTARLGRAGPCRPLACRGRLGPGAGARRHITSVSGDPAEAPEQCAAAWVERTMRGTADGPSGLSRPRAPARCARASGRRRRPVDRARTASRDQVPRPCLVGPGGAPGAWMRASSSSARASSKRTVPWSADRGDQDQADGGDRGDQAEGDGDRRCCPRSSPRSCRRSHPRRPPGPAVGRCGAARCGSTAVSGLYLMRWGWSASAPELLACGTPRTR